MREENRMQTWLNTAVSGIRFKPDREAVEQELREHLEDKIADLQRFYRVSHEEAEGMALERMGNAEEIGREMAKIHRPWLAWLWMISQTMVVILLCLAVLALLGGSPDGKWEELKRDFLGWEYDDSDDVFTDPWRWVDQESCEGVQVVELECPETQAGQYTAEVMQAQLWHYEECEHRFGDDFRIVFVRFRTEQKRPWEDPDGLPSELWAEDDGGTYIMSSQDYVQRKAPREWAERMVTEHIIQSPFEDVYQVIAVGVSPEATELTLYYDELGAEFVLPISLEGELVE